MGGTAIALFVLVAVVARFVPPIRGERRGRRGRRIRSFDLAGWREVADELGLSLSATPLPRLSGTMDGVALRLGFHRDGGARTEAAVRLPTALPGGLEVRPRRARFRTEHDVPTGDRAFDAAYRTAAIPRDPAVIARLTPEVRRRLLELGDAVVRADGDRASVAVPLHAADPDRLRTLLRAARGLVG